MGYRRLNQSLDHLGEMPVLIMCYLDRLGQGLFRQNKVTLFMFTPPFLLFTSSHFEPVGSLARTSFLLFCLFVFYFILLKVNFIANFNISN